MLLKLKTWYRALTPLSQLSIILLANWIIWFISSLLEDKIFYEGRHSLTHHILNAVCMSLFMTLLFAWNKVKKLFKSKGSNHATNGMNKLQ